MKKVIGIPALVLMLGVFLMGCGEKQDDSIIPSEVEVQKATEVVSVEGETDTGISNASEDMSFVDDPWNKVYSVDMPALYTQIVEVDNADDFEGSWKATNCLSAVSGNFEITNETNKGFHFEGEFLYGYRSGMLSGDAHFVSTNMAICNQDDVEDSASNGYMIFYLENDSLYVNSDPGLGEMGMSVSPNNEYTKGKPVYTNAENIKAFTQQELDAIHEIVGDELYEYPFLECTNNFILESSEKTLEDGTTCKYYDCYFSDMPESYTIIFASDGRIFIDLHDLSDEYFFTNAAEWTSNKMPEVK
ncbi:hypothetical protein D6853_05150 [Butyrivibrio sp. X503]|uniref:hypothetical protein n=1 Tax=Butyrivibrio sp. X503 TaxID=2364878 RepID=UPI000EA9130F|nr:hypothetical protein [Butyrivibrio sp. X503]RKM57401.1 hypothetical protein D6853_05150 [Butyrivibrio sp. X503]